MITKNPYIILPITGAIIGWLISFIAINSLFYPRKKIFGIQGVIPKRKEMLAEKISEVNLKFLSRKIETFIKIPFIGNKILNYVKKEVAKKVRQTNDKKIQIIIERFAKKELRLIKFSGALFGGIIGIIQAVILTL